MRTGAASAAAPGGGDAAGVPEAYVELAHRLADAAAQVTRRYFRRVLPSYAHQGRSGACFGHGHDICYHELAQGRPGSRQASMNAAYSCVSMASGQCDTLELSARKQYRPPRPPPQSLLHVTRRADAVCLSTAAGQR